MPSPSVLQVGSAFTFATTQSFVPRSLQPLRASLHFSTESRAKVTARFSVLLNNYTQIDHKSLSIKRRAAKASSEGKTEDEEVGASIAKGPEPEEEEDGASIAQRPDDDVPKEGRQFAQFAGARYWILKDAFRKVPGVTGWQVGFSQGHVHNPKPDIVAGGNTGHAEVVRIRYDPTRISYDQLLDIFWNCHDPTQKNRQGFFLGSEFRSGIYFYSPEQEKAARQSLERQQKRLDKQIVTEILPAKKFYRYKKKKLTRQRFEKILLGGDELSASWLIDRPKLPAAKEYEVPKLPAAKEQEYLKLPAVEEHEDPKLPAEEEYEDPVKV